MELNKVKVGDWITIVNSGENWCSAMDKYVGMKVQVTKVIPSIRWEGEVVVEFEGGDRYNWHSYNKHFIICGENYSIWN